MKIKKNGKVINLTESDLRRIVTKVIKEQDNAPVEAPKKVDPVASPKKAAPVSKSFEVTGAKVNDSPKSTILTNLVQRKDVKTGKDIEPYHTIYVQKDGKNHVVGNLLSNGKLSAGVQGKVNMLKMIGGHNAAGNTPDVDVVNNLKQGIKNSTGIDPTFFD